MSEASPYAIEAFVEILKNQAGPEKGYRTIRDKNFEEKDYYSINHYDCDENPIKSKEFVYVHIPEAEIEFAFEKDTQKLAFIVNYKD